MKGSIPPYFFKKTENFPCKVKERFFCVLERNVQLLLFFSPQFPVLIYFLRNSLLNALKGWFMEFGITLKFTQWC